MAQPHGLLGKAYAPTFALIFVGVTIGIAIMTTLALTSPQRN